MHEPRRQRHWLPTVIILAGLAAGGLVLSLDFFAMTAPGLGGRQTLMLAAALSVALAGVLLAWLETRGRIRLPVWPLPADPPAGRTAPLLVVWFALLAGLLEPLILRLQNATGLRFNYINPHTSWMSPLSYGGFFLILVGILLLVGRGRWAWIRSVRATGAALSFAAAISLLLLFHPELHIVAIVLLALGTAVQVFRALRYRAGRFPRFSARTAPALATIVALLTAYELGKPALEGARATAALPAATSGAPNVILIILDTVRGANVSFNGYSRETTPNLERRAREGVVFERAISTSSWSGPAHGSLVTGRYPFDLRIDWASSLTKEYPTIEERLAANGYRVAGFVANKRYAGPHTGIDRGAHHWDAHKVSFAAVVGASMIGLMIIEPQRLALRVGNRNRLTFKTASEIRSELMDWLDSPSERPFFAILNYFDAHEPHDDAPSPFDTLFAEGDRPALPVNPDRAATMARTRDGYDRSIAYLDHDLEALFASLETKGVLDSAVVIITSDHGEQFGESGHVAHGNSLDYAVIHVPLVLWGPGVPRGLRVSRPVSIRDIPSTIAQLAGATRGPALEGEPLTRFWRRPVGEIEDSREQFVFAAVSGRSWLPDSGERQYGNLIAALSGRLRYGRAGEQGYETLFDIVSDPWEQRDLANLPEYALDLARFRAATDTLAPGYMQRDPLAAR